MKRILTALTGGTIGSAVQNGVIDVQSGVADGLVQAAGKKFKADARFDTVCPYMILSENLVPAHWETLYNALIDADFTAYDGVIVAHGSDTLDYTAAAFRYLLRGFCKPVVFVAANYGFGHPQSNAFDNFSAAVELILTGRAGVYSVKADSELGIRSEECGVRSEGLGIRSEECGVRSEGLGIRSEDGQNGIQHGASSVVPHSSFLTPNSYFTVHHPPFTRKIAAICAYPGLDYRLFDFSSEPPAAILHTLYHSSTACAGPAEHSLPAFIRRCKAQHIDVYLLDGKHYLENRRYASGEGLAESGAYFLTGISFEEAYAKLVIAYNQIRMSPQKYMAEK